MSQPKDGTLVVDRQQSLQVREEHAIAPMESDSLLAVIARAAKDPTVDIEKMERLLAMAQKIEDDKRKIEYQSAMSRIQEKLPHIDKNGRQVIRKDGRVVGESKYALLEDIDTVIRPIIAAEGFSIKWDTQPVGDKIRVLGTICHRAGHSEPLQVDLPPDTSGFKNAVQAVKSTVSYGRRIIIEMAFNIIEEGSDRDGNPAPGPISEQDRNRILDLLISTGADEKRFLHFMGVDKVDDITAADLPKAMNALQRKQDKNARA